MEIMKILKQYMLFPQTEVKNFRLYSRTKRISSRSNLIEFFNYCNYINFWKYTKKRNCVKSSNNPKCSCCNSTRGNNKYSSFV
ncbi:hypothetical protein PCYB_002580, partial [Plasmodium cynomolgi strain B]